MIQGQQPVRSKSDLTCVKKVQLIYMRLLVNYRRYHIGDYFTHYATTRLEDLLTSGSLHDSLSPIKIVRWLSLRFSPGLISCPSRISLLDFHDLPDNIRSSVRIFATIIFCIGILIHSRIARFYKMT